MSYKNLEVWQIAREVSVDIHKMTLTELPKYEMYEEGNQIRRSSKDETIDHLETLFETGSLKNKELYERIHSRLETLGRKLNLFLQSFD